MTKRIVLIIALAAACCLRGPVRADDAQDCRAIIDKAVKALGGEEALGKAKAASFKAKTTITFNNTDNVGTSETTVEGLDHFRQEFTGEFNGNKFKGVTVLSGDKGARKFGPNATNLEGGALEAQKRTAYLTVIPITLVALRDKTFKCEPAGEEKVEDKPAVGIKVTPTDKKEFKLYFDKESGLPVKMVATVPGFQGGDFTQETTFSDYKDMGGIKKATKIVSKRNGEKFMTQEVTEFKVLDKVDPKTFTDVE